MFEWLKFNTSRNWLAIHDDVTIWKHFTRHWSFVRGIHRWIFLTKASDAEFWYFLWSATSSWANNGDVGDLRRQRTHYDVTVMNFIRWTWETKYFVRRYHGIYLYFSLNVSLFIFLCIIVWEEFDVENAPNLSLFFEFEYHPSICIIHTKDCILTTPVI